MRTPTTAGLEEAIVYRWINTSYAYIDKDYIFNAATFPVALKYVKGIYILNGIRYDHSSYEKVVQSLIKSNIKESDIIKFLSINLNNIRFFNITFYKTLYYFFI